MSDRTRACSPDSIPGLSEEEAARRLASDGPNELPSAARRSMARIALGVAREPMFLLLVARGSVYFALGDAAEGFMLLGFVLVVMTITFYQERKTERALETLRNLSSPRALVIRGGAERRIAGREVVRGDTVVLAEGDRVPADGAIIRHSSLSTDESLLTGESGPVDKRVWDGAAGMRSPGGDGLPFVYSGTMVVRGQGIVEVTATGLDTEIGMIGGTLAALKSEDTPLQRETRRIVRNFAVVGLVLCAVVVVTYALTRGDWIRGLLAGITLAMAIVPEEFPVVLTIFLALGAWHLSRSRVLTRHVPVIETLGSATVLCVDKTGTLTRNEMTVTELFAGGELGDPGLVPAAQVRAALFDPPGLLAHLRQAVPDRAQPLLGFLLAGSRLGQRLPGDVGGLLEEGLQRLGQDEGQPAEQQREIQELGQKVRQDRRVSPLLRRGEDKKGQKGNDDQGVTFVPHQFNSFFSIRSARAEASCDSCPCSLRLVPSKSARASST